MILITSQGIGSESRIQTYLPMVERGDFVRFVWKHIMTQEEITVNIEVWDWTERAATFIYDFIDMPEGMYLVTLEEGTTVLKRELGYICDGTPLTESTFVEYSVSESPNYVYVDD